MRASPAKFSRSGSNFRGSHRSLSRLTRLRIETFDQPIDEGALARQDFPACFLQREPSSAIDFGKRLRAPALRRPRHLEVVRLERRWIEVALNGESRDDLAARLHDLAEIDDVARRCRRTEFLFEFATRDGERLFAFVIFALSDRPGPVVLLRPERSAWMHQQQTELRPRPAVQQNAGATLHNRQPKQKNRPGDEPEAVWCI